MFYMIFIKSIEIVAGTDSRSDDKMVHKLRVISLPQKSSAILTTSSENAPKEAAAKNDGTIFFLPIRMLFE